MFSVLGFDVHSALLARVVLGYSKNKNKLYWYCKL